MVELHKWLHRDNSIGNYGGKEESSARQKPKFGRGTFKTELNGIEDV